MDLSSEKNASIHFEDKIEDSSELCIKITNLSSDFNEIEDSSKGNNQIEDYSNVFAKEHCKVVDSFQNENEVQDSLQNFQEIEDNSQNHNKMENNSKNNNIVKASADDVKEIDDSSKNRDKTDSSIDYQKSGNSFKEDNETEDSSKYDEKIEDTSKNNEEIEDSSNNNEEVEDSSKNNEEIEDSSKNNEEIEDSSKNNEEIEDSSKNNEEIEDASNNNEEIDDTFKNNEEIEDSSKNNEEIEDSSKNNEEIEDASNNNEEIEDSSKNNEEIEDSSKNNEEIEDFSKKNEEIEDSSTSSDDDCIIIETIPAEIEVITITDECSPSKDRIKIENDNNNDYNQVGGKIQSRNINPFHHHDEFLPNIYETRSKKKIKKERRQIAKKFEKMQHSLVSLESRWKSILNQQTVSNQGNSSNPKNVNPDDFLNQVNFINQRNDKSRFNPEDGNEIRNLAKNHFKSINMQKNQENLSRIPANQDGNNCPSTSQCQSSIPVPLSINSKRKRENDFSNPMKKSRFHESRNQIKFGYQEMMTHKTWPQRHDEPMETNDFNNENEQFQKNLSTVNIEIVRNYQRPEKQVPFDRSRLGGRIENEFFDSDQNYPNDREYSNEMFSGDFSNSTLDLEFSHEGNDSSHYNHHQDCPSTSGNAECYIQPVAFPNDWQSFMKRQKREQALKTNANNFRALKKPRLSDRDLFKQDNDLITVIVPENFRKIGITRFQRNQVLSEILLEIEKIRAEPFPRFKDTYIRHGGIIVECEDEWSRDWLIDVVPNLKPWKNANLSVVDLHCLEKFYRAILWIPGPIQNPRVVLIRLDKLNSELKTRKWRIHSCEETSIPEGFQIFLDIPNSSTIILQGMQLQPFQGVFKGFITVSRKEYKD